MHGRVVRSTPKLRPPLPLVVRAGLSRTFGSLAGFTAFALLSLGIYLLADAFSHPVEAQAAGLIVAAFAIALAILLFYFLLRPRRTPEMFRSGTLEDFAPRGAETHYRSASANARRDDLRKDPAYQRAYVDRSRIRPERPR